MGEINDGRPAFPVPLSHGESYSQHGPADGLTVREYFAAKAMQGLLANPGGPIQANGMNGWNWCNCSSEDVVNLAYSMADAMIRARAQEGES